MINPIGDEFNEEVPTSASADVGAFQKSNRGMAGTASDAWEAIPSQQSALLRRFLPGAGGSQRRQVGAAIFAAAALLLAAVVWP